MRQMTEKGDPMVRIALPEVVINMLKNAAKKNKRRPQDEFIKRIFATFQYEAEFSEISKKLLPELTEIYSV